MSSLARSSLRTTAAVAGIAAAGLGLAAPAVAAPAPQDGAGTDEAAPAAGSSPNVLGELPSADASQLPKLASVEGPTFYTASRSLPADEDLTVPTAQDLVNLGGQEQLEATQVHYRTAAPQDGDTAVPETGADAMVADLTSRALNSTEGNEVHA
ncbi:hypothetical protein ACU61A_26315 [Pseudonocardia sichuanensis]|uniref:Uncharacterized protein n=1 Tax=Pseudonocardia kunmingensis TaxID=630975 RepID=A0A543E3L7_9PSEU|nr:hypothetical protein [Pseudonocardia kunmingensis]TQM16181.1 hypothetical protein FB558_2988 [Pseudonocardia kunmingensis]